MKRLNIKFIAALLIALAVVLPSIYFLHKYQDQRHSEGAFERGMEALAKGEALYSKAEDVSSASEKRELVGEGDREFKNAVRMLQRYVSSHPNHIESRIAFAKCLRDINARGYNADISKRAWDETLTAIRMDPANAELRREAATFAVRFVSLSDALLHQEYLVTKLKTEMTLDDALFLSSLYREGERVSDSIAILRSIIGFNETERQFDEEAAQDVHFIAAYVLLADIYRQEREEDLANIVIDKMVEVNPDSFEAHRDRANYLSIISDNRLEEALAEAERAIQLEPNDRQTILVAAKIFQANGDLEKAQELVTRGIEEHPDELRMYIRGIVIANQMGKADEAMHLVEQGLENIDPVYHRELLDQKINLEIQQGDIDTAKLTLQALRISEDYTRQRYWPEREDYYEGKILLLEKKWFAASKALEKIRPTIESFNNHYLLEINNYLGSCYANLGQTDLQLNAVRRITEALPSYVQAYLAEADVLERMGKRTEAAEKYAMLYSLASEEENNLLEFLPQIVPSLLSIRINEEAGKPAQSRDWTVVDNLFSQVKTFENIDEVQIKLQTISLKKLQGFVDEAKEMLTQARIAHPEHLGLWLTEIDDIYQSEDASAALAELDRLEEALGESSRTRIVRARILVERGGENVHHALAQLEQDVEGEESKEYLWRQLSSVYMRINDTKNAIRLLSLVADNDPQDLPSRVQIFELAYDAEDASEINQAMARISKLCGEKDATWLYARALQLVLQYREEIGGEGALDEAILNLQLAQADRPKWHALSFLEARIAVEQGRRNVAIEAYKNAIEEGPDNPALQQELVLLLYDLGRTAEADRLLKSIPTESLRGQLQDRDIARAASEGTDPEELLKRINLSFPADSEDITLLLRRSNALQSIGDIDESEQTLRRAVEIAPASSTAWLSLVRHLAYRGENEEAEQVLRRAQMKVVETEVPLMLGRGYEALRLLPLAKQAYQMALAASPEDPSLVRQLAQFSSLVGDQEEERIYLDRICELSTGENYFSEDAKWARRSIARLLTGSNSYSDFGEALSFIEMNVEEGEAMEFPDLLLWSRLCANRADSTSRQRAIQRLEEERRQNNDYLKDELLFVLAQLYYRTNRWEDCQIIMRNIATRNSDDSSIIGMWCDWLMEHEQYREVANQARKLDPKSPAYLRLEAHRLARDGDKEKAFQLIRGLIAENLEDVPAEQNNLIRQVGSLFNELAMHDIVFRDQTEIFYRFYVQREPQNVLVLAQFLGRQPEPEKIEESFALLEQARPEVGLELVVQVALSSLLGQQGTLPDDSPYYTQVENWFDLWESRFPDAATIHQQRAAYEDMRGNYDEVERRYRLYIANDNIDASQRAIAQNNLAFIMALKGKGPAALSLANAAINQLGPLSDLLDTRAIAHISCGDFDKAILDLHDSLVDGDDPMKIYHLALAYAPSDIAIAIAKLEDAYRIGFDPSTLNHLERGMFLELLETLNKTEDDFIAAP